MPASSPEHEPADSGQELSPLVDESQVRRAVKAFGQRNTKAGERKRILARLQASGIRAAAGVPGLLDVFTRQDVSTRHAILDLFLHVLDQGGDFAESAEEIAKHLNSPNYGLRQKVGDVLVRMGPACRGAVGRILGCSRHAVRDVRLLAVRVLGAMGTVGADASAVRLRKMLRATKGFDQEMAAAVEAAMQGMGVEPLATDEDEGGDAEGEGAALPSSASQRRRATSRRVVRPASPEPGGEVRSEEERVRQTTAQFASMPLERRIPALLGGLRAESVAARSMAVRVLEQNLRDVLPFAARIHEAYEVETDPLVRDRIADLLTMIAIVQPGGAPESDPESGAVPPPV